MGNLAVIFKAPIQVDASLRAHPLIGHIMNFFGIDKQSVKIKKKELVVMYPLHDITQVITRESLSSKRKLKTINYL